MITITIKEPCKSCRHIELEVKPGKQYINDNGLICREDPEVRCAHEKVCCMLDLDDAQLFKLVAQWHDKHPGHLIMVSGHWEDGRFVHTAEDWCYKEDAK